MSEKKKHDPVKELFAAFQDELNHNELQSNYNRLTKDLAQLKEKHNELIPLVNSNLEKIHSLKDAILVQAMNGIIATEAISKVKEIEKENEKQINDIKSYKQKISETATLIERYEDWSWRKLFVWWKALKAVDPSTEPWLQWKEKFNNKII